MIRYRHEVFSFDPAKQSAEQNSFTLFAEWDFHAVGSGVLLEQSGAIRISKRYAADVNCENDFQHLAQDLQQQKVFDDAQHYSSFPMPDGSVPVIEAEVQIRDDDHPDWRSIRVGFPVSLYGPGTHRLTLHCDGVRLLMLVDGEPADEHFIYGSIPFTDRIGTENFFTPALIPEITVRHEEKDHSIQYFSTAGFNSWVGDVVPYAHNGVLHMFYLLDRRHHASRFGTGSHYYGHLTSTDLIHWEEQEPVGTLEHQWESCGTGTPFYHNGKYYFAYGLHTDRFIPREKNAGEILYREFLETGKTTARDFADLIAAGTMPEGMTYAVSDDGLHFEKSGKLPCFCENPSVYTMPDNTLRMYANGLWTADNPDGPWTCLDSTFPPEGKNSTMRNTLECPSFFEWGGHYYLIVGMDGMYASATPGFETFDDFAAEGRDIYDGLIVPMVFPFQNDRRLIAGWVFPFGSYLVVRELVQLSAHYLGIKWCPELIPSAKKTEKLTPDAPFKRQADDLCFDLTIDGSAGGRIALLFRDKAGNGCEFQLDLDDRSAQIESIASADTPFRPLLLTMREQVALHRDELTIFKDLPIATKFKCHVYSRDFRLDKLQNTDQVFTLRLRLKQDQKFPAALLDAEIAGVRTMFSLRPGLNVETIQVLTDRTAKVLNTEILEF